MESVKYSISDLAHYSGIKPHTIRIWEKRYNLFCPKRSDTNIRTYDNHELRKLINIQSLLQAGWKISKIVELTDNQIDITVKEINLSKEQENCPDFLVNSLIVHMLAFDEIKFSEIIDQVLDQYGIRKTIRQVIYPFLKRVGLLWQVNDITPAQEHFASAIIRRKLLVAIDKKEKPSQSAHRFILCLPSEEHHELPLFLAHYILLDHGIQTIYLGASVPAQTAALAGAKCKTSHLFTLFMANSPLEKMRDYLGRVKKFAPELQIHFSGNPELCQPLQSESTFHYIPSIEQFDDFIKALSLETS
jgi:MerR family transcriptional regulator, light-induced transcriptional regulator